MIQLVDDPFYHLITKKIHKLVVDDPITITIILIGAGMGATDGNNEKVMFDVCA